MDTAELSLTARKVWRSRGISAAVPVTDSRNPGCGRRIFWRRPCSNCALRQTWLQAVTPSRHSCRHGRNFKGETTRN